MTGQADLCFGCALAGAHRCVCGPRPVKLKIDGQEIVSKPTTMRIVDTREEPYRWRKRQETLFSRSQRVMDLLEEADRVRPHEEVEKIHRKVIEILEGHCDP